MDIYQVLLVHREHTFNKSGKPESDLSAEVSFVRLDPRAMGCVGGGKNCCRNSLRKQESEELKSENIYLTAAA